MHPVELAQRPTSGAHGPATHPPGQGKARALTRAWARPRHRARVARGHGERRRGEVGPEQAGGGAHGDEEEAVDLTGDGADGERRRACDAVAMGGGARRRPSREEEEAE